MTSEAYDLVETADLKVGDIILDELGEQCYVQGVYELREMPDIFCVEALIGGNLCFTLHSSKTELVERLLTKPQ